MKKNKKGIRWLYEELPTLVSSGVLSGESSEKLRQYYGNIKGIDSRKIALTIFAVIGSFLIGGGIILILAHNWVDMPKVIRTILSFAPLIIAQILAGYVIRTKRESSAWSESSAVFLMLSIASSIALIGQTYHIYGDLGSFLFTWMLTSFPIIYLLNSSASAILYLAGITAWAGYSQSEGGHAMLFWPLAALAIPHIWLSVKREKYSSRSIFLCWAVVASSSIATGIVLEKVFPGLWIIIYSGLFAVLYLAGSFWFRDAPTIWQRPFHSAGVLGITVLSIMLTYEWAWNDIGWHYYRYESCCYEFAALIDYILTAAFTLNSVILLVMCIRKKESERIFWGIAPVVAIVGYLLAAYYDHFCGPSMVLYNVYLFMLGIVTLVSGLKIKKLGKINAGMIIIAILIILRFFDSDFSFVVRGIAFIIVGLGFLAANFAIIKRNKTENALSRKEV